MKKAYLALFLIITSSIANAQDRPVEPCSFILPAVEYKFDDNLKHGVFLGIKKVNAQKGCDCSSGFGSLCYVAGTTYRINAGYYPHTKTGDVGIHIGYRYLFLYGEATAGYSFSSKDNLPGNFFHFGPTVGVDLLVAQVNAGYSFNTEKMNGSSGAFTLSVVFSPISFKKNKEYKAIVKARNNSTSEERKSIDGL